MNGTTKLAEGTRATIWATRSPKPTNDVWVELRTPEETRIAGQVFRLLVRQRIPTHYLGQNSPRTFHAHHVTMLPTTITIWRIASERLDGQHRVRVDPPRIEHLLKRGESTHALRWTGEGSFEVQGATPDQASRREPASLFTEKTGRIMTDRLHRDIEALAQQTFAALESAWTKEGYVLARLAVECGWTADGTLVIADSFGSPSWSLMTDTPNGLELAELTPGQLVEITDRFAPL